MYGSILAGKCWFLIFFQPDSEAEYAGRTDCLKIPLCPEPVQTSEWNMYCKNLSVQILPGMELHGSVQISEILIGSNVYDQTNPYAELSYSFCYHSMADYCYYKFLNSPKKSAETDLNDLTNHYRSKPYSVVRSTDKCSCVPVIFIVAKHVHYIRIYVLASTIHAGQVIWFHRTVQRSYLCQLTNIRNIYRIN